jgi:hypothetical protein
MIGIVSLMMKVLLQCLCPAAETNVDDDEDEKVLDYLDTPNAVL